MRSGALGAAVGVILGVSATLWSCRVDRPSEGYACSTNNDCDPTRICDTGYCVLGNRPADAKLLDAAVCPAICGGRCNFQAVTCTIIGTGSGNITCPNGWDCDISCPTPGACGTINCATAQKCEIHSTATNGALGISCLTKDCTIDCTGMNACGNINCTTGNCTATCMGSAACGSMSCTTGNCTEDCSGGAGAQVCGNMSCTTGDCTRTCAGAAACGTQTCSGDASSKCTETCSGGSAACGTMTCGADKCSATCMGGIDSSCGTVNCATSCGCQVTCDATTNICPTTMNCPTPGNKVCTKTGVAGTACSLDGMGGIAQCNTCQ